jgi:hypothetical protein
MATEMLGEVESVLRGLPALSPLALAGAAAAAYAAVVRRV